MNIKPIKVTDANASKIEAAIKAAEGRATQRTVSVLDVFSDIGSAEARLTALGIPKKYWEGTHIVTEESFSLPNSYGHSAESIVAYTTREKGSWKFTRAARGFCGKTGASRVILSKEAMEHIPRVYSL